MKAILVGNDDKSNGRLFYNPDTKKLMASSDYILNISAPSGPIFNLPYNEPATYMLYTDNKSIASSSFDLSQTVYLSPTHLSHALEKATILDVPFQHNEPHTLKLAQDNSIIHAMPFDILPYNPKATSDTSSPSINYPWLRNNAKAAIFLSDSMSVPKHGIIV